jgi:hypothetical protein
MSCSADLLNERLLLLCVRGEQSVRDYVDTLSFLFVCFNIFLSCLAANMISYSVSCRYGENSTLILT